MSTHHDITCLNQNDSSQTDGATAVIPVETAKAERKRYGALGRLSARQVLTWADSHYESTGAWPDWQSGPIDGAAGETWFTVAAALALGSRGFPRGRSLRDFLVEHRGPIDGAEPELSMKQIMDWAIDWQARTGRKPRSNSGLIPQSGGVSWRAVDSALRCGRGILPGGSSLSKLLISKAAVLRGPAVSEKQILFWADAYYKRTRRWPGPESGPVLEAPGENWRLIDRALTDGIRTLPGGSSLAHLLFTERGPEARSYPRKRSPLAISDILAWADAHKARTGQWPSVRAGRIPEGEGETWRGVDCALKRGGRALPGGLSLARVLKEYCKGIATREDLQSTPAQPAEVACSKLATERTARSEQRPAVHLEIQQRSDPAQSSLGCSESCARRAEVATGRPIRRREARRPHVRCVHFPAGKEVVGLVGPNSPG